MRTVTIQDLRQRWPELEAAFKFEREILVTRNSKPVAKLVRVKSEKPKRKRWDPEEHARWQKKVWGNKMMASSDEALKWKRADRWEKEPA